MSNDSNFDSLFPPFSIGKMEIKNRLVMSPHGHLCSSNGRLRI